MSSTTGRVALGIDRLEQRTLEQEALVIQIAPRGRLEQSSGRLEQPQLQQLPGVVPLVHGMGDVEPFVALKPDEVGIERRGRGRRQRRLADAGLSFQKEGLAQAKREEQRHGQPAVGHVVVGRQVVARARRWTRER